MMVSSLRPSASVCTAAGRPRYARLKTNALGPRRSQECDAAVGSSCGIYIRTIIRSDGQTIRRSDVQPARRQDGLIMSKTAYDGLTRSKTI